MTAPGIDPGKFRAAFVLLLVLAVSVLFLVMIQPFIEPLFLAAIFAGLVHPVYRKLMRLFKGRETAAALATLILLLLLIIGPLTGLFGIVANQAINVSEKAIPWVQKNISEEKIPEVEHWLVDQIPWLDGMLPSRAQLITGAGHVAQRIGAVLVASASKMTTGTAAFFLQLFVILYAMFFFLVSGRLILERILYYTPLSPADDELMLDRFSSITRATVKGTFIIALIQGTLGGLAFWAAGIQGAAFWGTIMVILSVIPGVGPAIVWIPAVIYLFATRQTVAGVLVTVWCAGVVGTIDNVLRPALVGKDARMPDLLILIGTLGGLILFGASGFIIGPIICGLFLTVWDIYGTAFRDALPQAEVKRASQAAPAPDEAPPEEICTTKNEDGQTKKEKMG